MSAASTPKTPITIAYGDGIGPEIMAATLSILHAAEAAIETEEIKIGEAVYLSGNSAGISKEAWESLRRTKVFLKAPITTPQGGGFKSLNVTVRKTLGLFANVRPCVTYHPALTSGPDGMDVVIVRENEEDLYAGIEHRQTQDVVQCLKLITEPGSRRIIRYAFEYAKANGRKKVTCMTKDNIMKLTDGLFHKIFDEMATEYPEIETDHYIIDIGMARIATRPNLFDVIVVPNLYGDIMSDIAAEVTGSVGLAGSANIGHSCAMFEAIHGSAPDIAGKGIANPSGLLLGAVQMLVHIGQGATAGKIHNAWLKTIEDGIHTGDIFKEGHSKQRVGTQEFAEAVIARLGQRPTQLKPIDYPDLHTCISIPEPPRKPITKDTVGVDVFINFIGSPDALAASLQPCGNDLLPLQMISNRGLKVWPDGHPETQCTDHWRCRFTSNTSICGTDIIALLNRINDTGLDFIKTENLCTFDGVPGFSLGQGQ
ncbi:isocitrate dehydrogenase [bacterium]|nr:isocitrate dehydrogenase [bacterium]